MRLCADLMMESTEDFSLNLGCGEWSEVASELESTQYLTDLKRAASR